MFTIYNFTRKQYSTKRTHTDAPAKAVKFETIAEAREFGKKRYSGKNEFWTIAPYRFEGVSATDEAAALATLKKGMKYSPQKKAHTAPVLRIGKNFVTVPMHTDETL